MAIFKSFCVQIALALILQRIWFLFVLFQMSFQEISIEIVSRVRHQMKNMLSHLISYRTFNHLAFFLLETMFEIVPLALACRPHFGFVCRVANNLLVSTRRRILFRHSSKNFSTGSVVVERYFSTELSVSHLASTP